MQENHARSPGAPPPIVSFFVGRAAAWTVLVTACALPLVVGTWRQITAAGIAGEALGIFLWIIALVIVGERLRWPPQAGAVRGPREVLLAVIWDRWCRRDADRRSERLRAGALALAVVHAALVVFGGSLGLFLWFSPVVVTFAYLPVISELESDFGNCLALTLMCGAQSAVCAWLCGHAIDVCRRALRGRQPR
jgi:hypothetical protein